MADPFHIQEIGPRAVSFDPSQMRIGQGAAPIEGPSFRQVLTDAIGEVQKLQTEADNTIRQLVAGEIVDVTQAMVAVERADVSFQTMMAVRNRIVSAYEEVMRMQV